MNHYRFWNDHYRFWTVTITGYGLRPLPVLDWDHYRLWNDHFTGFVVKKVHYRNLAYDITGNGSLPLWVVTYTSTTTRVPFFTNAQDYTVQRL